MSLKFYYDLLSQPSRAVMLFLLKNNIPFEKRETDLSLGENQTDEFGKVNPFRKVPAIVDGDFPLTESVAILRYLAREKNVPDHWYPKDSKLQARVDEYIEWQHLETRLHGSTFFLVTFLRPIVTGRTPKPERKAEVLKYMERMLDKIENIWLRDSKYLVGDKISIADLLGACEVEQPRMAGYEPGVGRPKLAAWLERVRTDLNPFYDEVHEKVNRITLKHKGQPPANLSKL